MNVNQLQHPPQPQLQRLSREASEKDADFLALRLLNKRSRLRLSPEPLDLDALPGKGRLFTVANRVGWFAAATRNTDGAYALFLSPLPDLRSAFASPSSSSSSGSPLSIQPRATVSLPATPHIVLFTQDDSRLLVAFTNGPIAVYDSNSFFHAPAGATPLHTFPSTTGKAVRDLLPSPGDTAEVAVLRDLGDGLPVEILDVHKMASVGGWNPGSSPATKPTSLSWSPKGKQIVIGLESGDLVTFSPRDTSAVKSVIPRPQGLDGQSVISVVWLSNPEFHAIYVPAGQISPESEQTHYILSLDSKTNTAGDVKLTSPYLPFPGLRPPGSFVVTLRNWEPTRLLLFVGDSTSSDIGLLGSLADSRASQLDCWFNFTLEETSTPSVPLDADLNETVLLGLDLDLTNDRPFQYTGPSGEETDVPPPPIMYLYASDGTLTGWHIIQTQGVAYPGMATTSNIPSPVTSTLSNTPNAAQSALAAAAPPTDSPSQPSAFGTASTPAGTGGGFGAFSGAPAAFGSSGFSFGTQSSTQTLQAPPLSAPTLSVDMISGAEDSMSEAGASLGGMTLGGGNANSEPKPGAGTSSMFGSFGAPSQNTTSSSPFGGNTSSTFPTFGAGPVKPGTGFGSFASTGPSAFGSSSRFASGGAFSGGGSGAFGSGAGAFGGGSSAFGSKPVTDSDTSKPASAESKPTSAFAQPAFGQSSFGSGGTKPAFGQSAFGQSAFGQSSFGQTQTKPAFGQSTFGNSSFGTSSTPAAPQTASAFSGSSNRGGSGFAAFASAAPASFAAAAQQKAADAKPAWTSGSSPTEQKSQEASTGSASVFGGGGGAFGSTKSSDVTSTTSPSSAFGGGAFGSTNSTQATSAFGGSSVFAPSKSMESSSTNIAPASGAFASLAQPSQGSAFGKPSFGQSSFGQSSFGQPSFGQSAFGKSAFGQPSAPASSTPSSGGFASFANAGPSAFSTAAIQKSPSNDSKPVWATASTDKPKEDEKLKSAFGATAPATTSVFGSSPSTAPVVPAISTTPTTSPEKPVTPATPAVTPPGTPEVKSAMSATPAPAPTGGAFAGLTTSSTGFSKLQGGFGAFSSTTPSSSPFLQKPAVASTSQSSSFFGQASFSAVQTDSKDSAATKTSSAFGSPSPLGQSSFFGKSNFGSTSSPFGKATPAPTTGTFTSSSAFSAFSSAPSPFAAAASGAKKSFGDMLREKEGDAEEEAKPQGISKTADEWKKPVSVFASLKQTAPHKVDGEEDEDEVGNISFRSQDDDDDGGSDEDGNAIDDFLRSDDEEDEGSEEEPEEAEEEVEGPGTTALSQTPPESPTAKQPIFKKSPSAPLVGVVFASKPSRSPSPSPSSPVPVVKIEPESPQSVPLRQRSTTPPGSPSERGSPTPSEPLTPDDKGKGKSPARGASTTPPGAPAAASAASTRATSAPPTATPPPTTGAGHLNVGRASTRPARSSPLASQPISGDDVSDEEDDEEEEPIESSPKKARSASPAVPIIAKSASQQSTSRPKTPPLLFGLGGPAKPPTPSPFTLTPSASPSPFGTKPTTPTAEKPAEPTRPAPTTSLKGPGTPRAPSVFGAPPVFSPPAFPQGSLFGQKSAASPEGLFGQKPATPAFASSSIFSSPSTPPSTESKPPFPAPAPPAPATTSTTPAPLFGSGFGIPAQPTRPPVFSPFGKPSTTTASSSLPLPAAPPIIPFQQPMPPPPQAALAQGMQTEFMYLFHSLAKELEDLKALATRAGARAAQLNKPGTGNKMAEDLVDPTKWIMGDLPQFKQIMKEVEHELGKWEKDKATYISYIRELESDMLKATTRKEEITRFSRASQDVEFARMLKARTLNPDHLETQAQLRRDIRTIRGRIQQLEDHIQASKKKLNSAKSGKPGLKPPSLDTINRTYRNIDLAIEQEEEDVSTLADRVAQIDMASSSWGALSFSSASTRDKRLPDRNQRVGREVTPNIAASTAAALNAERSAQKLKRALLKVRKEPLLNTKAVDARPPEREARIARKPLLAPDSGLGLGAAFAAGMHNGFPPALGPVPGIAPPVWVPPPPGAFGASLAWSIPPPIQFDPGSPLGGGVMRGGGSRAHLKSAHAHQAPALKPPPPPPPVGFSWGPLPKVMPKQTISIFSELGSSKGSPQDEADAAVKEEEKELGASWIADEFGASAR
ncbi:hypothetical protein C8Q79DRAFT_1064942 [Trametes meyenii]|nr:hypothetical protein C8Q79DRAFT_1064942 [Trametes meyenii]